MGDATGVGGSVVVVRRRTADATMRAGSCYAIVLAEDDRTRAGGGDAVVRAVVGGRRTRQRE